jgi:hypothetical protein
MTTGFAMADESAIQGPVAHKGHKDPRGNRLETGCPADHYLMSGANR